MYHKGNPPSEGCQDSGDPDLPVPSMRECGHRPERTESVWEPTVPLQGLWGLWGPGAQGAVYGGAEGADSASLSGAGQSAGVASAVWGLHRDGPEVDSKKAASLPPVAETLRPAEGGDVLGVSWGGRTGRSGRGRPYVGALDRWWPASWETEVKPPVGSFGRPSRKPIEVVEAIATSGRPMLPSSRSRPTAPWTRNQASWLLSSAGITRSVSG